MGQADIERGIKVLRDAQRVADRLAEANGSARERVMVPIRVIDVALELLTGEGPG